MKPQGLELGESLKQDCFPDRLRFKSKELVHSYCGGLVRGDNFFQTHLHGDRSTIRLLYSNLWCVGFRFHVGLLYSVLNLLLLHVAFKAGNSAVVLAIT